MILTRADGTSMFIGYGWIVEAPLPDAPKEARASVSYGGVTRHVRQNLEVVMDQIQLQQPNPTPDQSLALHPPALMHRSG
jgi:hypothetical protein